MSAAACIAALSLAAQILIPGTTTTPAAAGPVGSDAVRAGAASFPPGLGLLFVFSRDDLKSKSMTAGKWTQIQSGVQRESSPFTSTLDSFDALNTRPSVVAYSGGGGYASWDGVNSTSSCARLSNITDPAVQWVSQKGQYEIMLLLRRNSAKSSHVVMNSVATSQPGFNLEATSISGGYTWQLNNGGQAVNILTMPAAATKASQRRWHVVTAHGNAAATTLEQIGTGAGSVTTSVTAAVVNSPGGIPVQRVAFGAAYDCSSPFDLQLAAVALYDRELTVLERAAAVAALYASSGTPTTQTKPPVLLIGDSIMAGSLAGPTVWQEMSSMLGSTRRVTVRAVSAYVISQIASDLANELTIESPGVVIVEGGTNDMADTAANIYTGLLSLAATAKVSGAKVIMLTIPPGSDATKTAAVNASIRATSTSLVDVIVDANLLLRDGSNEGAWNTVYQQDTLHPNALGNRVYARAITDAVLKVAP